MAQAITTSVLVIDHNPILLEGIAWLLRAESDMVLVGAVSNLIDGVALAIHTRPDCILVDLDLHCAAGLKALASLRANSSAAGIVALVTYELDDRVSDALSSGASAVLGKDQISQSLVHLIRKLSRPA